MLAHFAPFVVFGSVVGIITVLLIVRALKRRADPLHALREQILKHAGQEQDPDDGKAPLRSPFKDSTQIGITARAVISPKFFESTFEARLSKPDQQDKILDLNADVGRIKEFLLDDWRVTDVNRITPHLPQLVGRERVYKAFKPARAVLTEVITCTFQGPNGTKDVVAHIPDACDIVMTQAFAGADNCFPNAPTEDSGIAGSTFAANAIGVGISWPTVNAGIDMIVGFAIESSVLGHVTAPKGYDPVPIRIEVKVRLALLGPSLR